MSGIAGALLSLIVTEIYRSIVPSAESRQLILVKEEVTEVNAKLDPFIKLAISRYPGMETAQALERLQREIQDVRAMASPPALSYAKHEVSSSPEGPVLTIQLKRSKDAPLGRLAFRLAVLPGSIGRIRSVNGMGATLSATSTVLLDGMGADLTYSSPGGDDPGISVQLSGSAQIKLEGNNGLEPLVLAVP